MAKTIKIPCPACDGAKCEACGFRGKVRGYCRCGHPADLVAGPVPLCEGCAAPCVLCGRFVDRFADGLPFGGVGLAHTPCALRFDAIAGRYLEGHILAVESDLAVGCDCPQVNRSTHEATGQQMPKTSQRTKDLMREAGFITVIEAAQMTGTATTTLYARIERGELTGRKSGYFHFVSLASLEAEYPQIAAAAKQSEPAASSTEAA